MKATPADTKAPEEYLPIGWVCVNEISKKVLGGPLFRDHEQHQDIMKRAHRFRSINQTGLFELAKDLARLTADSIDIKILQKIITPPKGEKWNSLKSLEMVLATTIGSEASHELMGPLFGVYEMRQGDAHLPSSDISESFNLLGIDKVENPVFQGYQLLNRFVTCLYDIAEVFEKMREVR